LELFKGAPIDKFAKELHPLVSGLAVSISTVKSLVRSRPDCGWLPKGDAVGGVSEIVLVGAGSVGGTELAPR
jgi:hypothetical protein